MDAKIATEWLTALRSGLYDQGQCRLKRNNSNLGEYCCLGVLCDVLARNGIGKWLHTSDGFHFDIQNERNSYVLPETVARYLNLETCPEVIYKDGYTPLSTLNDHTNIDFYGIADIVEKNIKNNTLK